MSLIQINWQPDRSELRRFGVAMLVMGLFAAGLFYWRAWTTPAVVLGILGAVCGAGALTAPVVLRPIYTVWMVLAMVLGKVISPVVLAICYYGVITPLAFVMRVTGRDKLRLRRRGETSYWVDLEPACDTARYERQF